MTDCTEIIINSPEQITYVLPSDPYVFMKGDQGDQGEQGEPGPPLLIKGNLNSVADLPLNPLAGDGYLINGILYTWTGTEWINGGQIQGPQGIQGLPGPANSLTIGTVSTGSPANATITGTAPNQILSLVIPQGIQGIQGIQGPTGLPPADSWLYLFKGITESDPGLEGASFPKTITLPPLLRQTTINKLAGLINTLSSGTAIISIQHGISSFTTITGLSTLACTTSVLADQTATANNIIPAGNRIRILFTSITGTLNLSFRLDISESL